MILRSLLKSAFKLLKQGKRLGVIFLVLSSLPVPMAIAQEKLQDFDYWASLCSSLVKSRKYKDAVEACNQAITLNTNEPIARAYSTNIFIDKLLFLCILV